MPWGGGGVIPPPLTDLRYVQNTPSHGGVSDSPTPDPVQRRLTNLSIVVGFNPPQLHNNIVKSYAEVEACIIKAIDSIPNNKKATISKLARYLDVSAQ